MTDAHFQQTPPPSSTDSERSTTLPQDVKPQKQKTSSTHSTCLPNGDAGGVKQKLSETFSTISIERKCVIPNCKCKRKPKKYKCASCKTIYYCCNKTMHSCYHYCPTVNADTTIQQSVGGGQFSKLDKI